MGVKQFSIYGLPGELGAVSAIVQQLQGDLGSLSSSVDAQINSLESAVDSNISNLQSVIGQQVGQMGSSLTALVQGVENSLVNDYVLPSFSASDAHTVISGVNKAANQIVYIGYFIPEKKGRYMIKFDAVGSVGSGCVFYIAMDLPQPESNNTGIINPGKTWLLDIAPGTVLSTITNFDTPSLVSNRPLSTNKAEQPMYSAIVEAGRPMAFWVVGSEAISGIKLDILYKEVY
ncbi:MAG: hypothetical protein VB085_08940 [Peptococcaceae bacterium]|nr:hypothetical protein [Peptococcaceae bacterium]